MKKQLTVLAAIAALALSGCSAGNGTSEAAPATSAAHSAASAAHTATASEASAESAPSPTLSAAEIADAKKAAIDSGRPENAWDKNCIAWKLPEGGEGQEWANSLAEEWLEYRGVECPDALVRPFYDITSFEASGPDTLVVNYSGNPEWNGEGQIAADEIMEDLAELGDAPKSVVVKYEKNGLEVTSSRP